MKKLLLATMLATAFATAQAQSSAKPNDAIATPNAPVQSAAVSVYGIVDAGFIGTNYQGVGANPNVKQHTSSFGNSAESTSRIGLRGSEDLGGGKSAFYTFETGLNVTQNNLSTLNNRQSFIGLKQNGLGQAAIGVQYTPIHQYNAITDPGQLNNIPGDVIWTSNPQANFNATGNGPYGAPTSAGGSTAAYTSRTGNTLNIASEQYKGFKAQAFYALNDASQTTATTTVNGVTTTTGGTTNLTGYGLGATYTYNKLLVAAAYQAFKSQNPGTVTTPAPALWTGTDGGVNTNDAQTYVAATYDFGILKGYAQWINRKASSTLNPSLYASRQAQQIGIRGSWTPVIESWASIGNGSTKSFGTGQPTANFVGFNVGTNYYLSKRTNFYAIYGQNQTSSTSGKNGFPGVVASGYGVGIRHTF
jgi:predicted porin